MIIHTDITRFYGDIIEGGEYNFLFRDYTVIDVGCNVGMFSLWLQDLSTEIHAIDISKENLENLNKTIKDSNIYNINTYNCGISSYTGTGLIEKMGKPESGGWRLNENGTEKIDVYTLKDFMNKHNIDRADIVKLDVEGEEISIIDDFPFDRVNTVLGEYHYENTNDNRKLRFEGIFKENGFSFMWHPNNHFIARK